MQHEKETHPDKLSRPVLGAQCAFLTKAKLLEKCFRWRSPLSGDDPAGSFLHAGVYVHFGEFYFKKYTSHASSSVE